MENKRERIARRVAADAEFKFPFELSGQEPSKPDPKYFGYSPAGKFKVRGIADHRAFVNSLANLFGGTLGDVKVRSPRAKHTSVDVNFESLTGEWDENDHSDFQDVVNEFGGTIEPAE